MSTNETKSPPHLPKPIQRKDYVTIAPHPIKKPPLKIVPVKQQKKVEIDDPPLPLSYRARRFYQRWGTLRGWGDTLYYKRIDKLSRDISEYFQYRWFTELSPETLRQIEETSKLRRSMSFDNQRTPEVLKMIDREARRRNRFYKKMASLPPEQRRAYEFDKIEKKSKVVSNTLSRLIYHWYCVESKIDIAKKAIEIFSNYLNPNSSLNDQQRWIVDKLVKQLELEGLDAFLPEDVRSAVRKYKKVPSTLALTEDEKIIYRLITLDEELRYRVIMNIYSSLPDDLRPYIKSDFFDRLNEYLLEHRASVVDEMGIDVDEHINLETLKKLLKEKDSYHQESGLTAFLREVRLFFIPPFQKTEEQ